MGRLIAIMLLAAVGAAVLTVRWWAWMGAPKPVTGISRNRMAFARWGTGPKTLLLMPGGPGNFPPGGIDLWMTLVPFRLSFWTT